MKRVKAACLLQTVCFQPKAPCPTEVEKEQLRREYEAYLDRMKHFHTQFKILEETTQPDGTIIIKLKKQYNQQALGDYFDD